MGLADYLKKRHFARTTEPKGAATSASHGRQFVIQQHAARHLHYDFRLEMDGVLKSWAVPRGFSHDPSDKHLAVHVEDHPLEYATFEGVIAEGEYGAGAVIVWDCGEWEPIGDAVRGYRNGDLKFRLAGQKLRGAWVLVRMRRKPADRTDNWLLIKERDEFAVVGSGTQVLGERPESVLSGRTVAEVAAGIKPKRKSKKNSNEINLLQIVKQTVGSVTADPPKTLEPALGRLVTHPPAGNDWLHEIKFDGYRLIAWLDHGNVILRTRHGHDWTDRFPEIKAAVGLLPANLALLDGEITALNAAGVSSFSELQQALGRKSTSSLVYQVFDVLHMEGIDLRSVQQENRKSLLKRLLEQSRNPRLQYVEHVTGNGPTFLAHCKSLGLEGIMSKRRHSQYRSGQSDNWLKSKCVQAEPLVIGGYTTLRGNSQLRSLVLGYHDERGRLLYAGRVGSGFSESAVAEIKQQMRRIERKESPFAVAIPKESNTEYHWVRPQLIAQVRYAGWTSEGILRHPTFEGLRDDVIPTDVVRELTSSTISNNDAEIDNHVSLRGKVESDRRTAPNSSLDELADVRLTTPQKVMYPEIGLTKLDLVRYYVTIADWILPYVVDRPLSLVRCPDGLGKQFFFQKHANYETPKEVHRFTTSIEDKTEEHLFVDNLKGLVSLVQIGTLEIHTWSSRVDNLERPDRIVMDLDPDEGVPFERVTEAAHRIRERLLDLGLVSFVKTTGGKGLHVVVPLVRRQEWTTLKEFSQRFAHAMASDYPQSYTATMLKRARSGRIYLDYLRNTRGATSITPYSPRARTGAFVAVPLSWEEVTPKLRPNQFSVTNLADRLSNLAVDPWAEMCDVRQSLSAAILKKVR
jgi:bifunctional non-homologous end joining protein LigD